ncbi:MAG: DNA polymerase III subunit gamma/tau [Clostridiales bacterium]|nr:DNA polymerase III subunit gamma/tau [Clostridiales bacterium]
MAHLALYRMFRPTALNDVVRQEHIVTVLKNQIETGRIGHAYLFCGPRGTGKTSIAKIFAAAINCISPVDGSACGKCEACKALKDPSNLDIAEIDAASNNGVDEMRDLREKVQYPPVAGKYKVYIIDEVHMLSPGAFNALLKTLEEPPAHAVFILATTESQKIPATILSRCMRFDFKLIPQADLEARLRYVFDRIGKTYEPEAIAAIARAGAGSVRDMLSVADTCVSYTSGKLTYADVTTVLGNADFSSIAKLCAAVLNGDNGEAFERTESFLAEGKNEGMLLKDALNFLNACAVAKTCRDGQAILALPDAMYAEVAKIAKVTDGHRLLRVTEIFAEVETNLKYSASPRILLETAVLKASMPAVDYDIEALLGRIATLEEKLANGVTVNITATPTIKAEEPTIKAEKTVVAPAVETKAEIEEVEDVPEGVYVPPDEDVPPDETLTGGYAYFDPSDIPKEEKPKIAPQPQTAKPVRVAVAGNGKATFGGFLRSLRKIARSGVLLTLCMDLECEYEGDLFVLYTTSDTVFRSLKKENHYALIEQALAEVGVAQFEVRLRGKKGDNFQQGVNEIKETFAGVKVEIK